MPRSPRAIAARPSRARKTRSAKVNPTPTQMEPVEVDVGRRLRELRTAQGLSIRSLAQMSGLNFNTLSLIENNKTSPSVSTLQRLALALQVPMTVFFQTETPQKSVVYLKADQRRRVAFSHGVLEDLAAGINMRGSQPLLVILEPGADSGPDPIVHTGYEFVYCLEGHLLYEVGGENYLLQPGDSLVFEAHLPHRWGNPAAAHTRSLLILCPSDEKDDPSKRHFAPR